MRVVFARIERVAGLLALVTAPAAASAQLQVELENNWLQWISFVTGQDEGIEQNLTDNFQWMRDQGYTHLRFFGIYPTGVHTFPSPTLDANGYPSSPMFEAVLPILVAKAAEFDIVVNFDGWEVIAESNRDPTTLGVDPLTEDELADVVREVLSYGVTLISEEQFGATYLRAIQQATQEFGATHETTAGVWWTDDTIADTQLASVFTFYPYDQTEADAVVAASSISATVGVVHVFAEGTRYYGVPFSLAVGSFGLLEPQNWKNVLLFAQIQHRPDRVSVEEADTSFTVGNPSFNFMADVGNEIVALAGPGMENRPIANFVIDTAPVPPGTTRPAVEAFLLNCPAIANTFTLLGYRVVPTVDTVLPDASAYFVALAGGPGSASVAPLPSYVPPLLSGSAPVFLAPMYGIPDENDAVDWSPLRDYFGLPGGDTQTIVNTPVETVDVGGATVRWSGPAVYLAPVVERIPRNSVNPTAATVELSAQVLGDDVALLLRHGNKVLINSNILHLEASYPLSRILGGPLRGPISADVVVTPDRALVYAEYDGTVDLDTWHGDTHVIRYDPAGTRIQDEVLSLDGQYVQAVTRGEFVYLRDVSLPAVPAAGSWALVTIALLVLAAGTILVRRGSAGVS